jgi:hypothetical protein
MFLGVTSNTLSSYVFMLTIRYIKLRKVLMKTLRKEQTKTRENHDNFGKNLIFLRKVGKIFSS